MDAFSWILVTTIGISLIAWIGVLTLFMHEALLDRLLLILVALAAGSLIGGAFLHLLPRAIAETGADDTLPLFLFVLGGFCVFYVFEQFINWHHHHGPSHNHEPVSYLVLLSDTLHNFLDGLVIAGAFLVNIPLGIVTTTVIALHEIPQEIGDYGVLVYGGFERRRALVLNYLTQVTVIIGGIIGYFASNLITDLPVIILPFAAGSFIYIASSDLIPEIKRADEAGRSVLYFVVFLGGILLMLGIRLWRHAIG